MRTQTPRRIPVLVLGLALLGLPAVTAAGAPGSEPTLLVDLGAGRFAGEYGGEETTTIDVVSPRLRWFLPGGEVRVTVPFVRLQGFGDVSFVGGSPTPGFRGRRPGDPPGGPPDGPPGGPPGGKGSGLRSAELGLEKRTVSGLGDVIVQGEAYLLTGSETRPWITALGRVKLPTADEDEGLGTGKTDLEAGLGLVQRLGGVNLLADASYAWIGEPDWIELRNVLRLGAGVSVPLGERPGTNVFLYLENRENPVAGLDDQRSLALGANARPGRARQFRLSGALFFGLSDTVEDLGLFVRFGRTF